MLFRSHGANGTASGLVGSAHPTAFIMGRIGGRSIGWDQDDVAVAFGNAPLEELNGVVGVAAVVDAPDLG